MANRSTTHDVDRGDSAHREAGHLQECSHEQHAPPSTGGSEQGNYIRLRQSDKRAGEFVVRVDAKRMKEQRIRARINEFLSGVFLVVV